MAIKFKVKKGDEVVVLAGKDKGKKGKILKMIPDKCRVIVDGVNMVKRHEKPSKTSAGGIVSAIGGSARGSRRPSPRRCGTL